MSASGGLIPTTRLPPSVVNSSAATNGLVPVANGSGGYAWKTVAEIALAGPAGPVGMTWRGVYSGATTYATNDAVSYQGSAYIATEGTTGVAPKTTAPWSVLVTLVPASVSASFVPTVGAPTNGVLVANTLYLQPIFVPYAATLTGVVWGNNETVTGNVIGSLYSAGLERAAKTTSVVMAGAYNTQAQAFESTYAAAAGVYYIGFQASSASAKFNKREIMGQWSAQAQGGFAAPATISALTAPGTGSTSPEVGTY